MPGAPFVASDRSVRVAMPCSFPVVTPPLAGYYHNRPKNSTNAPAPQRLTEDKAPVDPAAAAVPGLSAAGTAGRRSCFDAFQADGSGMGLSVKP